MTKNNYEKRMEQHQKTFEKLWQKIVIDTNNFIERNPEKTMYSLVNVEKFADGLTLSGAWIYDRINGKNQNSKGALTKKIRKVLGFTL